MEPKLQWTYFSIWLEKKKNFNQKNVVGVALLGRLFNFCWCCVLLPLLLLLLLLRLYYPSIFILLSHTILIFVFVFYCCSVCMLYKVWGAVHQCLVRLTQSSCLHYCYCLWTFERARFFQTPVLFFLFFLLLINSSILLHSFARRPFIAHIATLHSIFYKMFLSEILEFLYFLFFPFLFFVFFLFIITINIIIVIT